MNTEGTDGMGYFVRDMYDYEDEMRRDEYPIF